ncbi:MAG: DUF1328 domain-containing protein [Acidobacteria bacterium]|nr:DUF1328 domain-containing protein [Acidobacteriota bacterium]MCA1611544.1 DUF1328 domain-containing protein [Acidobacteriota bacterium]
MLRLAAGFLAVGVGSALFGLLNGAMPSSPLAQVLGLVALTLSLILLILGLPSIRNLLS